MQNILTTCCYCGCGCALYIHVHQGRIVGVTPSRNHPVSRNNLCVKGWHLHEFIYDQRRLKEPLIRRNGKLEPASWNEALSRTAAELSRVRDQHGGNAIGVLASAKCTNEENYLLQKLARAALQTNNVDHCARLCHAPTVAGLATTFGSGAMTNSINELEHAQVILVSGSNTTTSHPQVARRIFEAMDRGAKLIVIDPRRTQLARHAHIHLAIRPGTDIPVLNAMMRIIIDENLADDIFITMRTENFPALRDGLFRMNVDQLAAVAGVAKEEVVAAARLYARASKAVICYCMGITQHICGTANVQSFANLAMLAGHVEQEDTGLDPLRGQNNVQGACDMGALPNVFPGYQPVSDPVVRAKFAKAWERELPATPGLTLMDMTHHHDVTPIRAMFIMGENPMRSDPGIDKVKRTLEQLDFLAVSDMFLSETAALAHVVFPACSFAEKTGTFTNSERRVQLLRRAIRPLGSSMADHEIITALAAHMDYPMSHESPAEIMEEIALLTPVYGGISYDRLASGTGLQWPCYDRSHPGTPYLHKGSFSRGKGRFSPARHQPPHEQPDEDYPFTLITGRISHHFHTGTMTRKSPQLAREGGAARLEINPEDAKRLSIRPGQQVRLSSRRGTISLAAEITDRVPAGTVFTTFAFSEAPVNELTVTACDPVAKIPEFKVCAVRVETT